MRTFMVLTCVMFGAAGAAAAVVVTGRVPATGDAAADHDAALADARRRAVEETVGVLVDSKVKLENQLIIEDKILTRAAGLVKNESVQREGPTADGQYELVLACDVDPVPVEDLLTGLRRSVIVRIVEKGPGREEKRAAEAIIRGRLLETKFKCIDEAFMRERGLDAKAARAAYAAGGELRDLGRRYLAQVLIYGEVDVTEAGEVKGDVPYVSDEALKGLYYARASGNVKAVDTATGRIIAEKEAAPREFVGFGLDAATARAEAVSRFAEGAAAYLAAVLAPPAE